jgi:hypothetical protein
MSTDADPIDATGLLDFGERSFLGIKGEMKMTPTKEVLVPDKAIAADEPAAVGPEALIEQLRNMRQFIPDYTQLRVPDARLIRASAFVDPRFVEAAIGAISACHCLRGALDQTPDDLNREVADAARWSALEEELKAMLQGVAAANLMRKHRVGMATLQTYSISRQLVRQEGHADLLPHVAAMKRLNRFGRRSKSPGTEPEAPPPVKPL